MSVAADRNCAKSSSTPQLYSPPIKISLYRLRNHDCPSPQSKLRWIVVKTAMVLAADRNCAESSSKPQLATPPIEITLNRLRNRNCQNRNCANNKLNELNTIKWISYHVKWVGRAAGGNCAKSLSEQQLSSLTIKIALSRFRNSNWLLIPPTPGPVKYKYSLISKVKN